jgi:hypothetical protein
MRQVRKLLASGIDFLDALNCDSTISYSITRGVRGVTADVQLSDCNRKITWYFGRTPDAILKIDKAIEILTNFKQDFVEARKPSRKGKRAKPTA